MISFFKHRNLRVKNQSGFTLIEMLIVIIVLGILAMIIIPQITVSTEDAKVSTLQTNLSGIRSAVETYYAQHNNTYPGEKKGADGTAVGSNAEAATAFIAQLTTYTAATGVVSNSKTTTAKFGPYIKGAGFPANPFTGTNDVTCDYAEIDITVRGKTPYSPWKFYPKTGVFIANDSDAHAAY